jgi:GT2 family glycosyltransferase
MTVGLSAVFVTYNSEDCIEEALASVRRNFPGVELVVVDNASKDTTREVVGAFPGVRLVTQQVNLGFGRACNVGADNTTGTHLLFVNPDARIVSVKADTFQNLLRESPFGLIGPYFVFSGGCTEPGRDGLRPERHWFFAYASQTFGLLRPRELPRSPWRSRRGASWLAASVVLAEREEFDRLGRFDPRFFLYYEDRELSARYRAAGLPIRSSPAIRVEHRGEASSHTSDFRVIPRGWAVLGWIQYLHLRHGPAVAGRAARLALLTLRALALGLRVARVARVPRTTRKATEVGMLLDFIDEVVSRPPAPSDEFCPDAVRHLARRSRLPDRAFRKPDSAH